MTSISHRIMSHVGSGPNAAALFDACGRVFAASLARSGKGHSPERDAEAAASVSAFVEAMTSTPVD